MMGGQGNAMGPGGMAGSQMPGMDPKQRQDRMDQRMDMMQMMMEQMMQHDQVMQGMPMR